MDRDQQTGTVDVNFLGRRTRNGEVYVFIYTDDQATNMVRTLRWFANREDLSFTKDDADDLAGEVARLSDAGKVTGGRVR